MDHLFEILKLVEASFQCDRLKAVAYAQQLADKLEKSGEAKPAERVRRLLAVTSQAAVLPAGNGAGAQLPVDTESRLALADESMVNPDQVELFLSRRVGDTVDEFILYVSAADRLIEEGVGISPSLLLYGPPGCGKTELARLIAARLDLPLITARTDALISSYLGSTAKNLRMLFDHCAARPCVLFLDEFDAIAKLRDDRYELGELKRVVVSLLQNIDAIQGQNVLLAATNHEHLLDPAIWRRFCYHLHIDLPDTEARVAMFGQFLGGNQSGRALSRLAKASEGFSGSDIRQICDAARREAILASDEGTLESSALRRILLRKLNSETLSVHEMVVRAKEMLPEVYSHRALAQAFGMSPGNITHILRKHRHE